MNYKRILCLLLLLVIIVCFFVKVGKNMECKYCYSNGSHYHIIPKLSNNMNHGPRENNHFEHPMCPVCLHNKGEPHYHL